VQPGVRLLRGTVTDGNDNSSAAETAAQTAFVARAQQASMSPCPNPKNLYELWQENEDGIGGRKAAKLLSRIDCGAKIEHKYCRM
jgi:hypothetical protein